ncbi:MAG TPA: hypothetical protein VGE72_21875 [Azospirillum sp.]
MDEADLILAAIEQLGRNVDAKLDGLRTELKGDIAALKADLHRVEADLHRVEADVHRVEAGMNRLEVEVKTENRVANARLDEQRQTINALIPQRIAAVGRGTDAAE